LGSIFELGEVLLPGLITCWNYRVIRLQRSYLKGLIDNRDDADDK
jgi:hypothetical protein